MQTARLQVVTKHSQDTQATMGSIHTLYTNKCNRCKDTAQNNNDDIYILANGVCRQCKVIESFPSRFQNACFENSDIDTSNQNVANYLKNLLTGLKRPPKKGALLMGGVGTGKTHLIYCFCRMNGILNNYIFNTSELLNKIRVEMVKDSSQTFDRVCNAPYIFLDDFGTEKLTDWGSDQLYLIINNRYEKELPIFITTNLAMAEIEAKFSPRILSRIMAMAEVFEVTGLDRRTITKGE